MTNEEFNSELEAIAVEIEKLNNKKGMFSGKYERETALSQAASIVRGSKTNL